jgi:serine/threonine-protein kinase
VGGIAGFVVGVEEAPPLVFAPLVPMYMTRKLWLRRQSLREAGFRLRQLLPAPHFRIGRKKPVLEEQLAKRAPAEVLETPEGAAIRKAVEDRAAILQIFEKLSKADRASLPDLTATVKLLVERVAHLAQTLHRLDQSFDPALGHELDARIARTERETPSPEAERQLSLLRRQRATLDALVQRRSVLARQLESAGLALGSLRLDLIKVRSSGLQSALSDVSSATQEARALSNDIDAVLVAAAELKNL